MTDAPDQYASSHHDPPGTERRPDILCFSHLRWHFVYQRPQHLLTRCARRHRVFFFEEPVFDEGPARLATTVHGNIHVVVPHLPRDTSEARAAENQRELVGQMLQQHAIYDYVLWYYTPMALPFTRHLTPAAVLYDCMDELSAFKDAPQELREREAELLRRADLVVTGGQSLYEAKRGRHPNIHPLPSSVDVDHFAQARSLTTDPADQAAIPRPRLGFFGVIDERMDIELVRAVAEARPAWQIVLLGPVVKIDPGSLPRLPNIHYLGGKAYADLPAYIAGWDVALLPFARNESTRFISPTKTPEYLAAGKPVVSTSIRDVIRPYGDLGYVRIADTPGSFITEVERCLAEEPRERRERVDPFLAEMSWEQTWARLEGLINTALNARQKAHQGDQCSTI